MCESIRFAANNSAVLCLLSLYLTLPQVLILKFGKSRNAASSLALRRIWTHVLLVALALAPFGRFCTVYCAVKMDQLGAHSGHRLPRVSDISRWDGCHLRTLSPLLYLGTEVYPLMSCLRISSVLVQMASAVLCVGVGCIAAIRYLML